MRIGLVGLGFMAMTHIRAYRRIEEAELVAVCNPSGRRLDGDLSDVTGNIGSDDPVRLDMNRIHGYRDFGEMLSKENLDVVDICTPTDSHVRLAIQALEAQKHVLCEKPLARRHEDLEPLFKAVENSQTFLMPAMCLRFWPEWQWLRRAIQNQDYGRTLDAHFTRVGEPPAWSQDRYFNGKASGGALMDLHIHDTDFIQACFGKPDSVCSLGYSKYSGAYDHVRTQYRFSDGPVVSAVGSWTRAAGFGFNMAYTVNFENATADYDFSRGNRALLLHRKDHESFAVQCEGGDGYVGELRYFLQCVRDGTAPREVTLRDASEAIRICEAEEESIRTQREIQIQTASA